MSDEVRFENRMSDTDALMWAIEKDPMLRSTITTVLLLDGEVPRDELRRSFERLSRVVPRLRQRVRSNPLSIAPPRWEVDPDFELDYHLRFVRVGGDGTLAEVLRMAHPIAMQGFDRARPQWECTVVDGVLARDADGRGGSGGHQALIMKFHHAITDGVGGVRLMLELLDLEPDAPVRATPEPPTVHVMNQAERFADAFHHQSRRQLGIAKRVVGGIAANAVGAASDPPGTYEATSELVGSVVRSLRPASHPMSPLLAGRSLSNHFDTLTLPLDLAKKSGKRVGGTLNDAFVAGIVLAMRRYHDARGANTPALRMGMPINVRAADEPETAGNAFVPTRFEVPLDIDDPLALMRELRRRMLMARDEPANQLVDMLSNLINRLPTTVVTQVFGSLLRGLDFQASNVPGAPVPVYLRGVEVLSIIPFGPLAGAGANVTLLSYGNDLNIGVNVDPAAVTEPDVFMDALRAAYDDVLSLA